jgi:uncharacterized membrane protein YagU involved in acid resistance
MCHVPNASNDSVIKIILHMKNLIKLLSVLLSLKSCYFFPLRSVIQNAMKPPNKNYNQAFLQTIKLSRKKLQYHIADTWYALILHLKWTIKTRHFHTAGEMCGSKYANIIFFYGRAK